MTRTATRRHSTDMVSLVSGAIFLGVAGTWALDRADLLGGVRDWLLPLLLIGVGVIGLIGIRPQRRADQPAEPAAYEPAVDEPAVDEPAAHRDVTDQ